MPDKYQSPALQQAFGRGGKLKYDQPIYFRRPATNRAGRPLEHAGWIVVGSFTNRSHMEFRGFEALFQKYGFLPQNDPEIKDYDGNPAPLRSIWYPILTHPDGPKEFPLDQVMSNRWFEKAGLEQVFGWGNAPEPQRLFPQLGQIKEKIIKYRCPDCAEPKREFVDPGGPSALAKHLRIIHEWSRQEMNAWGDRHGINFSEVYGDPRSEVVFNMEPEAQRLSCDICEYVVPEDSQKPAASLRMHKMNAHKPVEVETVG